MSQHLIKEIQDLRHQVDSLRQEVRQEVQEEEEGLDHDKVIRMLWDQNQGIFKRIKKLEAEFYGDKQRREGGPEDFNAGINLPEPR